MAIRKLLRVLKKTFMDFFDDNIFKLSASLSYYTVFSIGPLLLIIVSVIGFFFGGREAAQNRILNQMGGLLGENVKTQLDQILNSFSNGDQGLIGLISGSVVLLLGATSIFMDMKDSINQIWRVKTKPGGVWIRMLINRLLSFAMVVSLGFLLLVSLVVSAVLDLLSEKIEAVFSNGLVVIFQIINYAVIIGVTSALFFGVYRWLPDARIRMKDLLAGSLFTSLMFLVGKFLITLYISNSSFTVTYGAAASIIILLAWVYYSSAILYLGAAFTRRYALDIGNGLEPKENAVLLPDEIIPADPSKKPDV